MSANRIQQLLQSADAELQGRWEDLQRWIQARFDREASIEAALFLIGIQSRGRGYEPALEREIKQSIIMEGTCCAFELLGLYERVGLDEDGAWIWKCTVEDMPQLTIEQQEKLLKLGMVRFFEQELAALSDTGPNVGHSIGPDGETGVGSDAEIERGC